MAIKKNIVIDGREIPFKASAAVPRLYRLKFGRDIYKDFASLQTNVEGEDAEKSGLDIESLEVFVNIAFIMAKHADPEKVSDTPNDFLERFNVFSIYEILPQLIELWGLNTSTIIGGIVNGIRSKINDVVSAVTNVDDTIRSYLHFSVPDVGPLTDFESWMPDFMSGLAEGINKKLITNAISGVAESMQLTMKTDMGVNFDGMTASMKDTVSAGTVVNNYNNSRTVNQTNNSPKSLSRLEIYRQTRNAMM